MTGEDAYGGREESDALKRFTNNSFSKSRRQSIASNSERASTGHQVQPRKLMIKETLKSNSRLFFLPAGEKVLSFRRSEEKIKFLAQVEQLSRWAVTCLRLNTGDTRYNAEKVSYKRGCIECLNFIIRASLSVPEVQLLKAALKLLSAVYIYFNELKLGV